MKFMYIISFFLFINFMLILLPRLMPNIITSGQLVFWVIWVNAIFIFTLILPHQASHIFPVKSGIKIFKMFKKINSKKANKDDEKTQEKQEKSASNAEKQEKSASNAEKQEKSASNAGKQENKINNTNNDLKNRIEERKNTQ